MPSILHSNAARHEVVVEASRNRALLAQFRAQRFVLQPLLEPNTTAEVAQRAVRSHATLLRAISADDADKAGEVMRRRIAEVRSKVVASADRGQTTTTSSRSHAVRIAERSSKG